MKYTVKHGQTSLQLLLSLLHLEVVKQTAKTYKNELGHCRDGERRSNFTGPNTFLFLAYCEISHIFTGQTHFVYEFWLKDYCLSHGDSKDSLT